MDCSGSRGPQEALSSGWGLRDDLESEVIKPVFISYSAQSQSSLWPLGSPIPHPPSISIALSLNSPPSYGSLLHPQHSFTTARAGFASAYTFSSVWALLLIPQAQLRGHPHQEAFLSHPPVPTGRALSLPELPEQACPFIQQIVLENSQALCQVLEK